MLDKLESELHLLNQLKIAIERKAKQNAENIDSLQSQVNDIRENID